MAHTPTPWLIDKFGNVKMIGGRKNILVQGFGLNSEKESVSNSTFIVRACNSHDELLEACKWALDIFDNDSHSGNKFFNGENSAIARLKLAIAKAEGK